MMAPKCSIEVVDVAVVWLSVGMVCLDASTSLAFLLFENVTDTSYIKSLA